MAVSKLVYIFMPLAIYLIFLYAPSVRGLGEASRIFFFHVPCSWVATLAFIVSGVVSIVYLLRADKNDKFKNLHWAAFNSAALGMLFTVLATITGSIWSKLSWGAYWNWDPRQVSIVFLILIYIAYFCLWIALSDNTAGRGKIVSVYLIFAMAVTPFFIFVIPRIVASLHPDLTDKAEGAIDPEILITLIISLAGFSFLYMHLLSMSNRITRIKLRLEEKLNDL